MKINALLDVDLVAHEAADEVAILLDLQAPAAPTTKRAPAALEVVLDRSGSMGGRPLEGAKEALVALVRRLDPTDHFGLVTFDDTAQVVVPAGPLTDKESVVDRIRAVRSGGSTDLSAGYLRGIRELRRTGARSGTVLVVSDGHVNAGIADPQQLAGVATKAYGEGVVTSTLGYGRGYDETLLAALARSGSGNHVFAANPDEAGAAIVGEVDGLLDKVVQGLALTVRFERAARFLRLYNDLPAQQIGDGAVMVELGDLFADERRKVLLKLEVPAMAQLGLARIATLELAYVELPGLVEHVATLPVSVNVVPGDEAAGRVPEPTVASEVLFQEAQDAKRQASEAYERGDTQSGGRLLDETTARLERALAVAPEAGRAEISAELADVERTKRRSVDLGAAYASKVTRDSYHRMNRKRGRTPRPDGS
jgi:Ca-activated chloride channel family protein